MIEAVFMLIFVGLNAPVVVPMASMGECAQARGAYVKTLKNGNYIEYGDERVQLRPNASMLQNTRIVCVDSGLGKEI